MEYRIRPKVLDLIREKFELSSDEAIAAKAGFSLGTISRVRRGHDVKLGTAIKLMDLAGITNIHEATIKLSSVA
ncbi:hypothetical protein D881_01880 [Corynebacterium ulcerans NCTC 12077]|uniref:HTH cro/C1-type domain-containing protein n=1 Tax=Corynebacterium ulcerans FRC58 TaxID=1408268 RepID=A0ABN4GRD2_CORUL|nr:hypothetical protein [Corynebacterium ulcerans]AKN76145.1 Hypothetical protein CulFRC58_0291 [Corynebacterium ulcerans FRC58]ESU59433.1 hypothetical protein D881_01880 [Corynebacterium ulcerans NCTC 12077]